MLITNRISMEKHCKQSRHNLLHTYFLLNELERYPFGSLLLRGLLNKAAGTAAKPRSEQQPTSQYHAEFDRNL